VRASVRARSLNYFHLAPMSLGTNSPNSIRLGFSVHSSKTRSHSAASRARILRLVSGQNAAINQRARVPRHDVINSDKLKSTTRA